MKTKCLSVRLTKEQHEILVAIARINGMTISDCARGLLMSAMIKNKVKEKD